MNERPRKQLIWAMLAIGALAHIAGCKKNAASGDSGGDDEKTAKPVVQVTLASLHRETMRATIPVTGTLAPLPNEEAKVAPLTAGRIQQIFVKTGDIVTKGQPVATLESAPVLALVQQSEATVSADAATLRQSRLNLQYQESAQQAAVTLAQSNLRAAKIALDKLNAGSRPQEIAQAQAAVTSAEAAVTTADQSLARSQTLYTEGLLARKDLEAAQAQQKTAQAQLRSAQEGLSLVKQGNRPQDIEAGRVAVQQAEDQIKAAEAQGVQNRAKAEDVRISERQLQGAEAALRAARAQLTGTVIRAPLSGTVAGRTLNPGESVDVTGSVVTIINLNRVRVLLSVPAAQIGSVHVGQSVEFTVESRPDQVHHAVISVVNRAVDPNTNTVQVEAVADNGDRQLRDDGFVRGSIVNAVHPRALVVPIDAVVEKDGKATVFVVGSDNIAHAKPIGTGLRDGSYVEALSGVGADAHVVTKGAYELEEGTTVHTRDSESKKTTEGSPEK